MKDVMRERNDYYPEIRLLDQYLKRNGRQKLKTSICSSKKSKLDVMIMRILLEIFMWL